VGVIRLIRGSDAKRFSSECRAAYCEISGRHDRRRNNRLVAAQSKKNRISAQTSISGFQLSEHISTAKVS
jgi:hypothetical protein